MNMRLISLSMNDMVTVMTLPLKIHGLLLMFTINQKRKLCKKIEIGQKRNGTEKKEAAGLSQAVQISGGKIFGISP